MNDATRYWFRSLAGTAISSFSASIVAFLVNPQAFSLFNWDGWHRLLIVAFIAAVLHIGMFLQKKPLPDVTTLDLQQKEKGTQND